MLMEIIIVFLIITITIIIIKTNKNTAENYANKYKYIKKECVMTQNELKFYETLCKAVDGCKIIPQAHLSMFLNHKVRGQSWSGAFSKINGKSVDFLICSNSMKPVMAIELDDSTHNSPKRQKRDIFVNSIINNADIALLRFEANKWNDKIIKQKVAQVFQTHASVNTDFQKSKNADQDQETSY